MSENPQERNLGVNVHRAELEFDERDKKDDATVNPDYLDAQQEQRRLAALDIVSRVRANYESIDEFLSDAARVDKFIDEGASEG